MKKIIFAIISILLTLSLCGCGSLFPTNSQDSNQQTTEKETNIITVHYHNNVTKEYTIEKDDTFIQCDFIAPNGEVIKGIYGKDGTQYADYDCKILLSKKASLPADLYAKYEDVDISYLDEDPCTALDEKPTLVSFYRSSKITWTFDPNEYEDDKKMIAACLCNPYADLTITVSFSAKGDGTKNYNEFYSKLIVCGETIGSFTEVDLGDNYTEYTYSGTIKALQLTNGDYDVKVSYGSTLGYEDHYVKNFRVDFDFDFNEDD